MPAGRPSKAMLKFKQQLAQEIDFQTKDGTCDPKAVADALIPKLDEQQKIALLREAIRDRAAHELNQKGTSAAARNEPEQVVERQIELFDCDVQTRYSIDGTYTDIDKIPDEKLEDKSDELRRIGDSYHIHADNLLTYIERRAAAGKAVAA